MTFKVSFSEDSQVVNFDEDSNFKVTLSGQGAQGARGSEGQAGDSAEAVLFALADTYATGDIVYDSSFSLFISRIDSNTNNALTDVNSWKLLSAGDDLPDANLDINSSNSVRNSAIVTGLALKADLTGAEFTGDVTSSGGLTGAFLDIDNITMDGSFISSTDDLSVSAASNVNLTAANDTNITSTENITLSTTNGTIRLNDNTSVTGDISVTGLVDGVDVAALKVQTDAITPSSEGVGIDINNVGVISVDTSVIATRTFVDNEIAAIVDNDTIYSAGVGIDINASDVISVNTNVIAPLAAPNFTGSVRVPTPTLDTQAANKSYVDSQVVGLVKSTRDEINALDITEVGVLNSGSIAPGFGSIDIGQSNITTTGDLSVGTIRTGNIVSTFGVIDTGTSDITTTGKITAGEFDVDNFRMLDNTISTISGDIILDPAGTGDIVVNAESVVITGDNDQPATLSLYADLNDDNQDAWNIIGSTDAVLRIGNEISGVNVPQLELTPNANVRLSTTTVGGFLDLDNNKIINTGTPTDNSDVATKLYVDQNAGDGIILSQDNTWGGSNTFSGGIDAGSQVITSVAEPTADTDAATKNYVDDNTSDYVVDSFTGIVPFDDTTTNSLAIGVGVQLQADNAIAIGNTSSVSGDESIAIGRNAATVGMQSIAMGFGTTAVGTDSISIGAGSAAATTNSGAIGHNAVARAINVITVGSPTQIPELGRQTGNDDDDLAIATKKYVDDSDGLQLSDNNVWTGTNTFNLGLSVNDTKITDLDTPTDDSDAANKKYVDDNSGADFLVTNYQNTLDDPIADGVNSFAIGGDTEARAVDSIALGRDATVSVDATRGIAIGSLSDTLATSGVALGRNAQVAGGANDGVAIGHDALATVEKEIRLGGFDNARVTIPAGAAGYENLPNQLVSKSYVDSRVSHSETFIADNSVPNTIAFTTTNDVDFVRYTIADTDTINIDEYAAGVNISLAVPATLSFGVGTGFTSVDITDTQGNTGVMGLYDGFDGGTITYTDHTFSCRYEPGESFLITNAFVFVEAVILKPGQTIDQGSIIGAGHTEIQSSQFQNANDTDFIEFQVVVAATGSDNDHLLNDGYRVGFRARFIDDVDHTADNEFVTRILTLRQPGQDDGIYTIQATHLQDDHSLTIDTNGNLILDDAEIYTESTGKFLQSTVDTDGIALTGVPTAPNPSTGDDSTQVATTAFVIENAGDAHIDVNTSSAAANAEGLNAIAIGGSTNALGGRSVVIGQTASASTDASFATAIGAFSTASASQAVALGTSATAGFTGSMALGSNAIARATNIITLGNTAQTTELGKQTEDDDNDLAVATKKYVDDNSGGGGSGEVYFAATGATANDTDNPPTIDGFQSVAIGLSAQTTGTRAIAIGSGAESGLEDSDDQNGNIAIGASSHSCGTDNVALGRTAETGDVNNAPSNSVAIGTSSKVISDETVAIGTNIDVGVDTDKSVLIGDHAGSPLSDDDSGTQVDVDNAIMIGQRTGLIDDSAAEQDSPLAIGNGAQAAPKAIALGKLAKAFKESSIAIGDEAQATIVNSIAIGNAAESTGTQSVALGNLAEATGNGSTGLGESATASDANATAIGSSTTASGDSSTAIGSGAVAAFNFSSAIGNGATARANLVTTIGSTSGLVELGRQTAADDNDLAVATKLYVDNGGNLDVNTVATSKREANRQFREVWEGHSAAAWNTSGANTIRQLWYNTDSIGETPTHFVEIIKDSGNTHYNMYFGSSNAGVFTSRWSKLAVNESNQVFFEYFVTEFTV